MSGDDRGDDPRSGGPGDPVTGPVFDEAFVRGAPKVEASAAARARAAERSRSAHDELRARRASADDAFTPFARAAARRQRTRRMLGLVGAVAVVVAFGLWLQGHPIGGAADTSSVFDDVMEPLGQGERRPSPQPATSAGPLGYPSFPAGDGAHEFIAIGPDGEPARYDPCRPIPVVVNPRRAPFDADITLEFALAEVSRSTGLKFVLEGTTDEAPAEHRRPYQPERYGDRWAPLLIAWSDQAESRRLGTDAIGTGGSSKIEVDDHLVFVTGQVTLDGPALTASGQRGGGAETRAVLLHELAHVVGLDHVPDPNQLMYRDNIGLLAFGDGDRTGLARLGRGPCFAEL